MMLILGRVTRVLNRPVDFDARPVSVGERADVRLLPCGAPYVLESARMGWQKTAEPFLANNLLTPFRHHSHCT